ncbi:MAG: PIG-L family deacetylase [Acidimicrobiia bacterium]
MTPHPDDAEYGAGGLLAALGANSEHDAHIVCFTPWSEFTAVGHPNGGPGDTRLAEAAEAAHLLGVGCEALPPRSLVDGTSAVGDIVDVFHRLRPDVVLTVDPDDEHPFHRRVSEWVQDAVFSAQLPSAGGRALDAPPQLVLMEAYTTRRFEPDFLVDVTDWFPQARRALLVHRLGLRTTPGLEYQMRVTHQMWGCRAAVPFAEGFRIRHQFGQDWAPRRMALFGLLADLQRREAEVAG